MAAVIEITVSPTSHSENPYSPTWYETPSSLIHDACCWNWSPLCEKSKCVSWLIQTPTSTSDTPTASEPVAYFESGSTHTTIAAPIGSQIRSEVKEETLISPGGRRRRRPRCRGRGRRRTCAEGRSAGARRRGLCRAPSRRRRRLRRG